MLELPAIHIWKYSSITELGISDDWILGNQVREEWRILRGWSADPVDFPKHAGKRNQDVWSWKSDQGHH